MAQVLVRWFKRYFTDQEGVILALLLVAGFAIVIFMGEMLAPLLASLVIAYLLEGLVSMIQRRDIARLPSVLMVFMPFCALLLLLIFGLMPLLFGQLTQLLQELPAMIGKGQQSLLQLPVNYPNFITEAQVGELMTTIRSAVTDTGQQVVSFSLASISGLFILIIYFILVPVLVFLFLKDKQFFLDQMSDYMPRERRLAIQIWEEMDQQIGNYVRGKFLEIIIVGVVTFIVFALMGLQYAMLLGALVGLSVVVPYIGAAAVTFPVAIIAYFQWGWSADFAYIMAAYGVIQALDGNLLVPWLFSEAVNLHPVAIITAVLVFGGLWGFWGVFFAIPLATLVKALMNSWPRSEESAEADPPPEHQREAA